MSEYLEFSIEEYLTLTPPERKLTFQEIALQMFDAIKEIHEIGYIHRDIKPDNFRIHEH